MRFAHATSRIAYAVADGRAPDLAGVAAQCGYLTTPTSTGTSPSSPASAREAGSPRSAGISKTAATATVNPWRHD